MMYKVFTVTVVCLTIAVSSVGAQGTEEENENDPFKNDPFFTKKIDELLNRSSNADSVIQDTVDDHKFSRTYLNYNGIDYEGILEAGPYNSNFLFAQYPHLPMIHFNRVDALFLGIRKERMQWHDDDRFLDIPNLRTHWLIGYSFGQDEFQYTAGVEKYFGYNDRIIIGWEFHNATTTDDHWRVGLTETSLTAFAAGFDFLDYYKQKGFGSYLLFRTDRLFEGGIAYGNDRFNSLSRETDWALFGSGDRFRPNSPVEMTGTATKDTLTISNLAFSASFNPKRLLLSKNFTFSLTGTVEWADPGLGRSDFSYTKYLGEVITFINFEPGGVIKNRFRIGAITGDAPSFKEFELGGIGSLRALPFKARGPANQMILSNTELQFGSPDLGSDSDWIDFDDFFLSFFLDSGWTGFDSKLLDSGNPLDGFSDFKFSDVSHNGGFGIGSNGLRFELAWDLIDTSRSPVFWVRFNPAF